MFPQSILGRLAFAHAAPGAAPLPPGRNWLGIADERDTLLYVPAGLEAGAAVPLLVMFHGAGGSAEKVLPFLEAHAERNRFLLMVPQSTYPTWDLTIGGNGPDIERLGFALTKVAGHFLIERERFGFAGFSDGASYSLSIGLTNGDLLSHVIAFSGGFMNVYTPHGKPQVFIAHSPEDEQLAYATSGPRHAEKLRAGGYEVEFVEFHGRHVIHPPVVEQALHFFLNKTPAGQR
ncbi:MAG: esterase [Burkholderiaceae bacterium]|nr:esterase [Burkholderiaceae bacterium]